MFGTPVRLSQINVGYSPGEAWSVWEKQPLQRLLQRNERQICDIYPLNHALVWVIWLAKTRGKRKKMVCVAACL
jgi:phosphatidylserine decarboxylase